MHTKRSPYKLSEHTQFFFHRQILNIPKINAFFSSDFFFFFAFSLSSIFIITTFFFSVSQQHTQIFGIVLFFLAVFVAVSLFSLSIFPSNTKTKQRMMIFFSSLRWFFWYPLFVWFAFTMVRNGELSVRNLICRVNHIWNGLKLDVFFLFVSFCSSFEQFNFTFFFSSASSLSLFYCLYEDKQQQKMKKKPHYSHIKSIDRFE